MLPGIKLFDLHGRVAIVTGGSKGLGEAMAAGLASAGASLVIVSRKAEELDATAKQLAADYGQRVVPIAADVSKPEDAKRVVEKALAEFGRIDILLNNAGINIRGPIEDLTFEQFQQVQKVNVDGVWLCTQAVVPHMKLAKHGRIINVSSTLGLVGLALRTPYAASKGAVLQMTKALALELAPWNITCNALCPGPFLTPMNIPIAETEDAKKNVIGATALGRWGRMEEIQGAAIYLASDASSYTTGVPFIVDGGWTAR